MSGWSVDDLHRAEVWTAVAPSYDAAIAPIMQPYAATMLDLLDLTRDAGRPKLLDVAAGTGVVAIEAARRGADTCIHARRHEGHGQRRLARAGSR